MSKRSSPDEPTYVDFVDDFLTVVKQSLDGDALRERVGDRVPASSGGNAALSVEAHRFAMGADDGAYLNAGVAMLAVASAADEPPLTSPASYSAETLQSTKEALLKLAAVDRKAERKRAPARVRSAANAFRPLVQNYQALHEELDKAGVLQTLEEMDSLTADPEIFASNAGRIKKLFKKLDELLDPRKSQRKVVDAIDRVAKQAAEEAEREANNLFQSRLKELEDALEATQTQHTEEIERIKTESETLQTKVENELQAVKQKYGADTKKLEAVLQKRRAQLVLNSFKARQNALALKKKLDVSEASIRVLQLELKENETKLQELTNENSDLTSRNNSLKDKFKKKIDDLNEAKKELEAEILSLYIELQNADELVEAAQEAERKAVEKFQAQIGQLNTQLEEALERYTKNAESSRKENAVLQSALQTELRNFESNYEADTSELKQALQKLQKGYKNTIEEVGAASLELKKQLEISKTDIEILKTEIEENEKKLDEMARKNADLGSENKRVNSRNVRLLNQDAFYKQENASLKSRLSSVLTANERLETENQLIQIKLLNAQDAIQRLQDYLDSKTEDQFDASQADVVVENATATLADLQNTIDRMQGDIDLRIQENNQLRADLADQKEKMEKSNALLVQFKAYSNDLEKLNRKGEVEYNELEEKYDALMRDLDEKKKEGNDDKDLIDEIQEELQKKKGELEKWKRNAVELEKQNEALAIDKAMYKELEDQNRRLKAQLANKAAASQNQAVNPPQNSSVRDRINRINQTALPAAAAASLRSHLSRVARAAEALPQTRSASRSAKRAREDPEDEEDCCPLLVEETLDAARSIDPRASIEKGIETSGASSDVRRLLKRGLASMLLRNPLPATAADDDDGGAGAGIGTPPGTPPDSPGDATPPAPPPPAPPTTYVQIQDGLARFVNDAFVQLALFEPMEQVESKINDLFPSGTASERRGIVWNEMLRDAALAGDRLWAFVRTLSGLIGESADSIFSSLDETAIKAQSESKARRDEIAKQVSDFQGKLLSELAGSLLKNSTLQFATSSNESDKGGALVVVDAEAAKKIKDMAAGTSGMPFFEANVALRHLESSASGKPQSVDKIVSDIAGLGQALHDRLMEQLVPTLSDGVSLTELAHPRNSYCVRLKDDTTAAILEAFDRFATEFALRGGNRVKLWELVEGADATLSQRFAAFVGHVLVQNRTSTGVNALYTSRAQLSVNSAQASVSLQRLVNQAAAYRSRISAPDWTNPNVTASRTAYFAGATNATQGTWVHNSFRGVGPSAALYRVGWIRGISY
jgi:chromosome segregation ATPase